MSNTNFTTEVLIIGAGPTGLMAANQLMRFGIDFIIVDCKNGPTKESRAIAVTARSLEIYQQMGLSQQAIEKGKRMNAFNLYSGGKEKAKVKIGEIGKGFSEFSYMLAFEQSRNEEMLAHNLESNGKKIHWNYEFVELKEYNDAIHAVVKNNNELYSINAKYLIACDGARSPVRHQLNFSFKGGTYDHKFFVADTKLNWKLEYDNLVLTPGDKNFCGFLPLYGEKNYRVLGTLPKEFANREDITFNDIEKVIKQTAGIEMNFEEVSWFSIYKLHHRGVDHFSQGRVFLAGDSAHIHSPAGGQGMNTGLQDAYNLCWKLAFVLRQNANPELLNTYNEERLPFAKFLLKFTDRGFNMMTSDKWYIRFFRKYIAFNLVRFVSGSGRIKPLLFKTISQTGYSYKKSSLSFNKSKQKLKFTSGDRLPYLHGENIYPEFTAAGFHLLHINADEISEEKRKMINNLFPFPVKIIESKITEGWTKLGMKSELFILVRPDNYLGLIMDSLDVEMIKNYLKKYF